VFLCKIRTKRGSAGIWVLEKYAPHQSVSISCYFSDHALYLIFIQVYKTIFTSPSSARDISEEEDGAENMPPAKSQRTLSSNKPTRRNVASKVNLNDKVTPRSIAYAAVQVGFMLLHVALCLFAAASSISTCKLRVHGPNFMEDLTTRDCITISSMFSKIPLGLHRRSAPKTYLTGGRSEYSLFLQRIFN
jgi:hypothetical protein